MHPEYQHLPAVQNVNSTLTHIHSLLPIPLLQNPVPASPGDGKFFINAPIKLSTSKSVSKDAFLMKLTIQVAGETQTRTEYAMARISSPAEAQTSPTTCKCSRVERCSRVEVPGGRKNTEHRELAGRCLGSVINQHAYVYLRCGEAQRGESCQCNALLSHAVISLNGITLASQLTRPIVAA